MRLDVALVERGFFDTRAKAAQAVRRGEVTVFGKIADKPAYAVDDGAVIEVCAKKTFVSLGGYKLDKAFSDFGLDCKGLTFADLGASTGGFTDVLLQRGAKKVYCVDVGEGLLDEKIANDPRVVDMSGVNARYISAGDFTDRPDGVVVDCSFISLKLILPTAKSVIKGDGFMIALVKPQFECGEKNLGKSGVLFGVNKQKAVISDIYEFCKREGLSIMGMTYAPLYKRKNTEYLLFLRTFGEPISFFDALSVVENAAKEKGEL